MILVEINCSEFSFLASLGICFVNTCIPMLYCTLASLFVSRIGGVVCVLVQPRVEKIVGAP